MNKICHILTDKNIGGAGRWLLYYLKYCNRDEFDVTVILPKDSQLAREAEKTGIKLILLEGMKETSFDKQSIGILTEVLKKEKPDLVHTHASFSARIAAKKAKIPFVVSTKHCMEGKSSGFWKKKIKGFLNQRYSNKMIAVSNAVKESMIDGGTHSDQIITLYNGVELLPLITEEKKKEIKKKYGIEEGKFLVGMLARLEEIKDHPTFLRGIKRILETTEEMTFLIAGTGTQEQNLKNMAKEMGISNHVIFTGFVQEIELLTSILDLNVITSKEEALCLSILEGMGAGVPAVGTDSGGIREVIRTGYNGELVPVGDWEKLADKILYVAANQDVYHEYSKNAKKMVQEQFLAEELVKKLEQYYLEWCGSNGK